MSDYSVNSIRQARDNKSKKVITSIKR